MRTLRNIIYRSLPRPKLQVAKSADRAAGKLLILSKYPNPTVSYYLDERIKALSGIPISLKGLDDRLDELEADGLFVIICRYIKRPQLRWLEQNREKLAGIAYFVDDDIASVIAGDEAGWPYKLRLFRLAVLPLFRLNRQLDYIWVSTKTLANALPDHVDILAPMPPKLTPKPMIRADDTTGALKMIYHATGIHRHEHAFLMPIVQAAMSRHENLHFEVFADGTLARRWRGLGIDMTRMTIRRPLPWTSYLTRTTDDGADIALVPLLAGRTNDSRADTKRIDISRMGAAAIFSRCATFDRCAVTGEVHVDNMPELWLSAIDKLVRDRDLRASGRNATIDSLEKMRQSAVPGFPGVQFHVPHDVA